MIAMVLSTGHASAATSPNDGWATMDCGQYPLPGCELSAGTPGGGSGAQPTAPSGGVDSGGAVGHGGKRAADRWLDGSLGPGTPTKTCRYVPSDYRPPEGATQTVSHEPPAATAPESGGVVAAAYVPGGTAVRQESPGRRPSGSWYVYRCSGGAGLHDGLYRPPVFLPDGPNGPPASPSPWQAARQAYSQLRLPTPAIAASPPGPKLVRLPTWLWLDRGWEPVSATASVPGVSVTATARPDSVVWSMGDGGMRRCDGPGTPYSPQRDPRSASPDCGYTYRTASGSGGYPVTATIHWRVSWSGAGQSGSFGGLRSSTSTTFEVAEVGAVNGP